MAAGGLQLGHSVGSGRLDVVHGVYMCVVYCVLEHPQKAALQASYLSAGIDHRWGLCGNCKWAWMGSSLGSVCNWLKGRV